MIVSVLIIQNMVFPETKIKLKFTHEPWLSSVNSFQLYCLILEPDLKDYKYLTGMFFGTNAKLKIYSFLSIRY